MKVEKGKWPDLWFGLSIVLEIIFVSLFNLPPNNVKSVIIIILIGIFVSVSIISRLAGNKKRMIIANIVFWSGIITASVILLY